MSSHVFALVDCNSFYCSCERLFRPDLSHTPVGVLSNNDGCFVSRTKELKKLNVGMGEPFFKVKELCEKNNVAVFSANFALYTNLSDRVMRVLSSFTPELEIYSVDEAFLNLSGFEHIDLDAYAREIKRKVERDTGIPVSVGVGRTKTLAKVANNIAKKSIKANGVVVLLNDEITDIALAKTPIGKVWGIGRASEAKFSLMGIRTALDLKNYKNDRLIQRRFTKVGLQTKEELEGKVRFELELVGKKKKEIMCSRTFGSSVFEIEALRESIANYVSNACMKLRRQDSVCSKLEVFARTSPHKNVPQYVGFELVKISANTSDTLKVIKYAIGAVEKLYKQGYEYKKAGIRLCGLKDSNESQLSLLEENDTQKSRKLMEVMDKINEREGDDCIRSGACGVHDFSWRMNRNYKSPRYLTGYNELPKST